jgi:hypothetical protein
VLASATAGDTPSPADGPSATTFGFTGPEIFPVDLGISNLRVADLDGDGLNDLVIANNARSKINLLFNQTGQTNQASQAPKPARREINELPPDARFRIDSIASEKRIAALVVADLNQDKKPDLAYYGEPKELVVQYNQGKAGWSNPKRWSIEDGQLTPNALTAGDLDGDERIDLMLLGEQHIYFLRQTDAGTLAEPERIAYSSEVKSVQVLDIDGDRLNDLLLVNWEETNPFRFRLQNPIGSLGPEHHFSLPPIRSYWAEDLDGDGKTEVVTIAMNSGRVQIFNFVKKKAESITETLPGGQFQVLPLYKTTKARRGICWSDLNGDGRSDLLVSEPDSGQLTLFLQKPDGSLPLTKTFPTLAGVTDLAVRRAPAQDIPELFLLSQEERQVGVTRFEPDGRIPFPAPLPIAGKPLALAVGQLGSDPGSSLAVILEDGGRRALWLQTPDGKTQTRPLREDFRSNPAGLAFHDADQDGRPDLVILIPYEKIKILRQKEEREFEELDIAPPGGSLEQPWMSRADLDKDGRAELLLGQKNFVRVVVLTNEAKADGTAGSSWIFRVTDQINGVSSRSRIIGATLLAIGSNAVPSLFLLDAERKWVSLCQRDPAGVWQIVRNLPLPFSQFQALESIALGAPATNSIAFLGLNAVGWLTFNGENWELAELDSYETPIRDGRLFDVVSGDLNKDGRQDLVFLETAKNYLDLVIFKPDGKLQPANRWPVFEARTFRGQRPGDQSEPREALVADLTGDGKNDLAVVVHDRIVVYPQQ